MLHFIKDLKPTISKLYDRYDYIVANCITTIIAMLVACFAFAMVIMILVGLGRMIAWLSGLPV